MMHGEWRLQSIGEGDRLPLIQAVYILVAVVVVAFILKTGLLKVDDRRRK